MQFKNLIITIILVLISSCSLLEQEKSTIYYESNGGVGNMIADTVEGDVHRVKESTFQKDGYYFNGWNTEQDGGGTSYSPGQYVNVNGKKLTLYAQWSDQFITYFSLKVSGYIYTGNISDSNILIDVPYGSDITSLVATFTTTEFSVSVDSVIQESGVTENDFTNTVIYTVTADDGSSLDYSVIVNFLGITKEQIREMVLANEDVTGLDTSHITDMSGLFKDTTFNQDISSWDVSSVSDMSLMFLGNSSFNQDISSWDVSSVSDMSLMFFRNSSFNQDISSWDVSNVTDMSGLFLGASSFNQNILSWNVSNVTNMDSIFRGATSFNQDISSWDVSKVTDMSYMFRDANSFNGDISSWNVGNVTKMNEMFNGATSFNGDISNWNVGNVTNMSYMFYEAEAFNQDISSWDVSKVTDMSYMFRGADSFIGDISSWDVSNVTNMSSMFRSAHSFNQDLSSWNEHVSEDILHTDFALYSSLQESYHPYTSWAY